MARSRQTSSCGKPDKLGGGSNDCRIRPRSAGKPDNHDGARRVCRVRPGWENELRLVGQLAQRQEGVVGRAQLLALGISRHTIDRWLVVGILHALHRGVYAVGHLALAPRAHEWAAILACGERTVISHRSAAGLWGLVEVPSEVVEVTVPRGNPRPQRIIVHRGRVDRQELRRRHGLPLTSPARTLIDLAHDTPANELERLIAEARIKRLIRPGELERALRRAGRRWGSARLRAVLRAEGEPGITRSAAERRLRRLLRQAGLPQPQTNVCIGRYEADFLWPVQRVIVEVDSWGFHGHRRAFEQDRRKGLALETAGYHVLRISASQLETEPLAVIALLARALDRAARVHG